MTLCFPDLNVWLALSVAGHSHSGQSWKWLNMLAPGSTLLFSRYTQIGLLRLLTNEFVMGEEVLSLAGAWQVYDRWLRDPRVEFYPEPRGLDRTFRATTASFAAAPATKTVGDCYLLSYAVECDAVLVTYDKALFRFAHKQGHRAVLPG